MSSGAGAQGRMAAGRRLREGGGGQSWLATLVRLWRVTMTQQRRRTRCGGTRRGKECRRVANVEERGG